MELQMPKPRSSRPLRALSIALAFIMLTAVAPPANRRNTLGNTSRPLSPTDVIVRQLSQAEANTQLTRAGRSNLRDNVLAAAREYGLPLKQSDSFVGVPRKHDVAKAGSLDSLLLTRNMSTRVM
jgi:hypothetical protein